VERWRGGEVERWREVGMGEMERGGDGRGGEVERWREVGGGWLNKNVYVGMDME